MGATALCLAALVATLGLFYLRSAAFHQRLLSCAPPHSDLLVGRLLSRLTLPVLLLHLLRDLVETLFLDVPLAWGLRLAPIALAPYHTRWRAARLLGRRGSKAAAALGLHSCCFAM